MNHCRKSVNTYTTDMNNLLSLSRDELKQALTLTGQIAKLEKKLASILGANVTAPRGKRSGMSEAGRARIAAAQRVRWAKAKGKSTRRRTMSAVARKRISAAAKVRWAMVKAAGKNRL